MSDGKKCTSDPQSEPPVQACPNSWDFTCDNAFKFIVIFMVLGKAAADEWAPLIGFVFALPFILFSAFAGQLATRFSKRRVAVGTKYAEVLIMLSLIHI